MNTGNRELKIASCFSTLLTLTPTPITNREREERAPVYGRRSRMQVPFGENARSYAECR
jgi:hypothetical protein